MTTMDFPYSSADITDTMYEPKANQTSTAHIEFISVLHDPSMRPLLEQIKDGDRVEIYNFQPDVGYPVFAGFIPPGGITVSEGRLVIDMPDCMGAGQWQRTRAYEEFDTNADGYYTRGMSWWKDYLNENFDLAHADNGYIAYTNMYSFLSTPAGEIRQNVWHVQDAINNVTTPAFQIDLTVPGTTILIEVNGQTFTDWAVDSFPNWNVTGHIVENSIGLTNGDDDFIGIVENYTTDTGVAWTGNSSQQIGILAEFSNLSNDMTFPPAFDTGASGILPFDAVPMPSNKLYAIRLVVNPDLSISAGAFINYIQVAFGVFDNAQNAAQKWYFKLQTYANGKNTYQEWYSLRVRYLVPWIARAGRFIPQTQDPSYFKASTDDMLTFFMNHVELDFAEYRPIYQVYPAMDQVELDGFGLLGVNASKTLGIDGGMNASAPPVAGTAGVNYPTPGMAAGSTEGSF